jgi:hypothetical protein
LPEKGNLETFTYYPPLPSMAISYHRSGNRLVTDSAFLQKNGGKGEMVRPRHEAGGKIANKTIGVIRF